MTEIKTPENIKEVPLVLIKNMISLATSGFGVVVALAWNDAIKATVSNFIDPWLGKQSGVISMFIYAGMITIIAVSVTAWLAYLEKKIILFNSTILTKKTISSRNHPN